MLELLELGELAAEQLDTEMIQSQIEDMTADYKEALAGGFEDIANTYKEKIEVLKGKMGAHQGTALEGTSEEEDEAHQGRKEISFGSSDIKTLEARVDKWLRDVEFHEGQLETSVRQGKDTSKNMSDLKSAKEQYKAAVKELEWARAHS